MNEQIEVPAFNDESEEAAWWYANREAHGELWIEAMDNGSARRVVDVLFEHGLTLQGLKEVSVPVDDEVVEMVGRQAERAGMGFREYMGKVLHDALKKGEVGERTSAGAER